MKKKILIVALLLLVGGGYEAKGFLLPPAKHREKITGTIYILPGQFLVNLTDGRFGKINVALELAPGQSTGGGGEGAASPPEGFGTLPEEPAVRDIITNILTDQNGRTLISAAGRARIKHRIVVALQTGTDLKVDGVLFTDVAVQ